MIDFFVSMLKYKDGGGKNGKDYCAQAMREGPSYPIWLKASAAGETADIAKLQLFDVIRRHIFQKRRRIAKLQAEIIQLETFLSSGCPERWVDNDR
jgi:hypothetical protein